MGLLGKLEKHPVTRTISLLAMFAGAFFTLESVLSTLNILPFYKVRRYPISGVTPSIHLFPGQKIKLAADFVDAVPENTISEVDWRISQRNRTFEATGIHPTVILPVDGGGTYELAVEARILNEQGSRKGQSTFHVEQNSDQKIKFKRESTLNLKPSFRNRVLPASAESVEVYVGDSTWSPAIKTSAEKYQIKVSPGTELPVYEGRVIYRLKGKEKDLSAYGTLEAPNNLPVQKQEP